MSFVSQSKKGLYIGEDHPNFPVYECTSQALVANLRQKNDYANRIAALFTGRIDIDMDLKFHDEKFSKPPVVNEI